MTLHLTVSSDQRITFIGQTQMGKTTLVSQLIEQQPRVWVVDSKEMLQWKGYHLTDNPMAVFLRDKVIFRPRGGQPPDWWWMEAVRRMHERGGGVVYLDEGSYITDANRIPKGLQDAIRLGAQIGVGVWVAAQESTTVHNTTLRQADMLILFYNQGSSDRDKLSKVTGDMAHVTRNLPPYEFVVFKRGETYDHDAVPTYTLERA